MMLLLTLVKSVYKASTSLTETASPCQTENQLRASRAVVKVAAQCKELRPSTSWLWDTGASDWGRTEDRQPKAYWLQNMVP